MEEKISVVIAAYNQENEIEKAVRSALSEDLENMEVIVVNDGSTDRTGEVLSALSASDERLRVITKENGGVSSARNEGIRAAAGRWLVTLDGDDYFEPGALRLLADAMENGAPRPGLVITGMRYEYPDHAEDFVPEKEFAGSLSEFLTEEFTGLSDTHLVTTHCNKLYDLEILRKNGIFYDESLRINEDIDFVFRYLAVCNRVKVIPGICIHYVQHKTGESQIGTFRENGLSSSLTVLTDLEALVKKAGVSEEASLDGLRRRMLVHILSFSGVMYRQSGYCGSRKREELRKLCENEAFTSLLSRVKPEGLKEKTAATLLRGKKLWLYHLLCTVLYRI